MQEEKQNISPIKQRILSFAETLGISKREFYLQIGVSRGTLESKSSIGEIYRQISASITIMVTYRKR